MFHCLGSPLVTEHVDVRHITLSGRLFIHDCHVVENNRHKIRGRSRFSLRRGVKAGNKDLKKFSLLTVFLPKDSLQLNQID